MKRALSGLSMSRAACNGAPAGASRRREISNCFKPTTKGGSSNDLRASHLSLPAEPNAEPVEALRNPYAADMGEARHSSGRLLDDDDRRVQSRAHLPPGLGIACRARAEMGRVSKASGMGRRPGGQ